MAQLQLSVSGMSCARCVDKIEKFVGSLDGISAVNVDLASKSVSVEFAPPATEALIKEAILDAGFEVNAANS